MERATISKRKGSYIVLLQCMKQKSSISVILVDAKALIKCLIASGTTTALMFCLRPETFIDVTQAADLGMFIWSGINFRSKGWLTKQHWGIIVKVHLSYSMQILKTTNRYLSKLVICMLLHDDKMHGVLGASCQQDIINCGYI